MLRSKIQVTVPAPSRALLTTAELRLATSASSGSINDADLNALGLSISDLISVSCNVRSDGVHQPTLLQETIVETVRITDRNVREGLLLSRRFVSSITSITDNDITLDPATYEFDGSLGAIYRLINDAPVPWSGSGPHLPTQAGFGRKKLVVTYVAGFDPAAIPPALKQAARTTSKSVWLAQSSSVASGSTLKSEWLDGVGRREYYQAVINPTSIDISTLVPTDVYNSLAAFRTYRV